MGEAKSGKATLCPYNAVDKSWDKMQEEFSNAGYREGITFGKESALQEGFDTGFAQTGAPIGRQLGVLRGLVAALKVATQKSIMFQGSDEVSVSVEDLQQRLNRLGLKDLAPRDMQAEAHAREHRDIEAEGTDDALASAFMSLDTKESLDGKEELLAVEREVHQLLDKLGLQVSWPL